MTLLVVTQAVDAEDKALGFFVRWLEELAAHFEAIEVICLKEGKHTLPANVQVHALGKPASRFRYIWNFYKYIFSLNYDAVFVHMNEEYVLLGGLFWFLNGTKVFLWRNHANGSWWTRLAVLLSHKVLFTSPHSFTARFRKALKMPVGIDTHFFKPDPRISRKPDTLLFLGRLDPVKKVAEFVEALSNVRVPFHAALYGSPTKVDSSYAHQVVAQAQPLIEKGVLTMHSGVSYEETRKLYQSHAIYVNFTPSGSFDKTIFEAAACGTVPLVTNTGLRGLLPDVCVTSLEDAPQALERLVRLSEDEKEQLGISCREGVVTQHSLTLLGDELARIIQAHIPFQVGV